MCRKEPKNKTGERKDKPVTKAYTGTASVSQGIATTIADDLYTCDHGRKTDVGEITSSDGKNGPQLQKPIIRMKVFRMPQIYITHALADSRWLDANRFR
ncbi:MAG: hypothetical protein ABJJ05_13420 [Maribacter litoralis]|uniref:hypothetical protein n=1 Tax=Maribacter litoralis TaxID=2059726 RepID=UPI003297A7F1